MIVDAMLPTYSGETQPSVNLLTSISLDHYGVVQETVNGYGNTLLALTEEKGPLRDVR
jgi:hypothetical protein